MRTLRFPSEPREMGGPESQARPSPALEGSAPVHQPRCVRKHRGSNKPGPDPEREF